VCYFLNIVILAYPEFSVRTISDNADTYKFAYFSELF
jgi:hypothetical protein